jgi:predicted Zn-ribbon and HTH transcriptional regulator
MIRRQVNSRGSEIKKCKFCGQIITSENCYPSLFKTHNYACKGCSNQRVKEWQQKQREYYNAYARNWRAKNRERYNALARQSYKRNVEKIRAWRKEHAQEINAKNTLATKRKRLKLRQEILSLFDNKCPKCGFSDPRALQIDHIRGGGRKDLNNSKCRSTYYLRVLQSIKSGEKTYQILCANCNAIKMFENGELKT